MKNDDIKPKSNNPLACNSLSFFYTRSLYFPSLSPAMQELCLCTFFVKKSEYRKKESVEQGTENEEKKKKNKG